MKIKDIDHIRPSGLDGETITSNVGILAHICDGIGEDASGREYFITKCRRVLHVDYWDCIGTSRKRCKECFGVEMEVELSDKSLRVLSAIIRYKIKHDGNSPTLRDLMRMVGISSTSVISHHLRRLELAGKIERGVSSARDIVIPGAKWIPPDYYTEGQS